MRLAVQFGLDDAPGQAPFHPDWLGSEESVIIGGGGDAMSDWVDFGLDQAILCPFYDKSGELAGLIQGAISSAGSNFYEPITAETVPPFTVMVQQVAAIWNTRQLNDEMRKKNARLEAEMGKAL